MRPDIRDGPQSKQVEGSRGRVLGVVTGVLREWEGGLDHVRVALG